MDYLDPKKQARHTVLLLIGYVLTGVAIAIATLVLLYQAYGFGLNRQGKVIQNGLFFFSSQPHPAQIYVNGQLKSVRTNTRLSMPAGVYEIILRRDGYRDWQRTIALEGGSVEHYDYPFLIPNELDPSKVAEYGSAPRVMTQSPDRRWLMVQKPGSIRNFDVYDLKNPEKPPLPLALPQDVLTKASGSESWQPGEWADDNQHVLLRHVYDGKLEYVMIDRTDAAKSINLDSELSLPSHPPQLVLNDKKYDRYYLYGLPAGRLSQASLDRTSPKPYLDDVLAYKSYGDDTMLYVTPEGAKDGEVLLKMRVGSKDYTIRSFPAGGRYLVDLTEYSGSLYVAAGAARENKLYIYKDPAGQLEDDPGSAPVPSQVLRVHEPDYLSFSDSAQFIMIERSTEFAVYDIENEQTYHYKAPKKLDKPQRHAVWMDGNRLAYVSGGRLIIFDYDNTNRQELVPASPLYEPAFTPDFQSLFTLAPSGGRHLELDRTWLLTPPDR
jgi:hypothetical protein